jgi:hypothetical protein
MFSIRTLGISIIGLLSLLRFYGVLFAHWAPLESVLLFHLLESRPIPIEEDASEEKSTRSCSLHAVGCPGL